MTGGKELHIGFGEGDVAPSGSYAFELDVTGQSGCDIIEHLMWLIRSLKSPYQVRLNQRAVAPEDISVTDVCKGTSKLTVWTNDASNADFLLLVSELGVDVVRSVADD